MQKNVTIFKITFLWMVCMGLFATSSQSQAFTDGTNDAAITPVHLIRFSANKINSSVQVNWATTNEINNSHFNVQRGVNGINFTTIGTVLGKGNIAAITNYAFTDTALPNSTLYYRLQQVDVDGKRALSATVVIKNDKTGNTLLSIYPNPIKGNTVVLSFTNAPTGVYRLTITNINGAIIHNQVYNQAVVSTNSQVFLATKPTAGWYVVSMINAQGIIIANKTFIVE